MDFDCNFIVLLLQKAWRILSPLRKRFYMWFLYAKCCQQRKHLRERFFLQVVKKPRKSQKLEQKLKKNVSHVFAKKAHDFSTNTLARLLLIAALTLTYRLKCCGTTFSAIQEQALWLLAHSSRLSWLPVLLISCLGYPTSGCFPWYPPQDFRLVSISKLLFAGTVPPGRDTKSVSSPSRVKSE